MNRVITQFRPSSHSVDYTIVATFKTEAEAKQKQAEILRKHNFEGELRSNKILVSLSQTSESGADDTVDCLAPYTNNVQVYNNYQEMTITFTLPRGLNNPITGLIFSHDQQEIYNRLCKLCGKPKITRVKNSEFWVFRYEGEKIYFNTNEYDLERPTFFFDAKRFDPGDTIITVEDETE
jgi:hypothetical protein